MNEQRLATIETPLLTIPACQGNLVVKSWRETAVSIQGDGVSVEQSAPGALRLTAAGDLYLAVPKQARLALGTIGGSLTIKHVSGGITIDEAGGPVTLGNVDAVTITRAAQEVHGDNINGPFVLEEAGGPVNLRSLRAAQIPRALADVTLQFANGHVSLGQVDGRLDVRTVNGDVTVQQAQGQVILANLGGKVQVTAGQTLWLVGGLAAGAHRLAAEDVYVYWPPDAPLNLTARGALVEHNLPLENEAVTADADQTILTGHIEEGPVDLFIQAGQRAALKASTGEPPQFTPAEFQFAPPESENAAAEGTADAATAVRAVLAEIAAELPPETVAQLAALDWEERLVTAVSTAPVAPAAPAATPADEQRHILQLLKDGLLSVEQAQLLLDAL